MNYALTRRWISLAVPILVLSAITYGVFLAGPPSEQRKIMLDRKRVADLGNIEQAVNLYHARQGNLPETLALLPQEQQSQLQLNDPETGRLYGYERTGKRTYRLCADFSGASEAGTDLRWTHGSGHHCFTFHVKTNPVDE